MYICIYLYFYFKKYLYIYIIPENICNQNETKRLFLFFENENQFRFSPFQIILMLGA